MANQKNNDAMLQRMKTLMNYGINESRQPAYSNVEHSKVAADGKLYGIVREGTNFFVKVAKDPKGAVVAENFDYINGFRNRKDNMFESFAAASRFFDEKMININESLDRIQKNVITENYINEKKDVIAEQTDKMQEEIARQRQIMENAQNIMEKKEQFTCKPKVGVGVKDNSKAPKCGAEKSEDDAIRDYNGKKINAKAGNIFNIDPAKPVVKESTETPLSSRSNPEYMDKSHGTEIGNNAPFAKPVDNPTENAVAEEDGGEAEQSHVEEKVNEEATMHDSQNQNTPAPGVSEPGDTAPFDKKTEVNEAMCELDDELEDGDEDFGEEPAEDDEFDVESEDEPIEEPVDDETPVDDSDIEADVEGEGSDIQSQIDELKDKMDQILAAINDMKYDDDEELYDDEGAEEDTETEEPAEEDIPTEEDECVVRESKSFKAMKARMMNEESRLDDFGKHPAYQKTVMSLPSNENPKRDGQYDMNDGTIDGQEPYGTQKGDNAPFNVEREKVENEIVENIIRKLKKKLG